MKKFHLKRWVKVTLTLLVIHLSFFIWKQTGVVGEMASKDNIYLALTVASWMYLIFGQVLVYQFIWEN